MVPLKWPLAFCYKELDKGCFTCEMISVSAVHSRLDWY